MFICVWNLTTYTYDANQQMDSLKVTKGTSILLEEKIGYDVLGLLQTVTSTTGNKTFSYDKGNQLLSQDIPAAQLSETYTYDATGNRASRTTTKNGVTKHTAFTYNGNNELETVNGEPYTYDKNGNRTLDSRYSYTYNKFDQLTSITDRKTGALTATYTYDDAGRRTSKAVGGKITNYHYGDGIQVLFETDAVGTITAEYIYDPDGLPLVLSKGTQNYYYVYNSLKEIVGLTDRDGNFVATYSYDAWGNILSQSGAMAADNPLRYKGARYDDETDLYYLIARYYQPEEGVFFSADPEGGDLDLAITQNGYNYMNNNPVMMSDTDGNYAWLVIRGC
ncbi:hypothetical protein NCCP2716_10430 [Sporosarcina sp. NCCP-2716]|uniref:RHS repeat-associated core domain-containing protein n=1 Tax=Sporosarcina sp. NCCP-2716 TaxID=2943679 RepID=UPI00203E6891|nr:RHS repeat-associated core domain-containing protein [Sporosarcina sp. NCCP-2716]GKV68545.1 hypothetical protein NCCP2716_10430 [Sporosarcina sp. NCCP-2716]